MATISKNSPNTPFLGDFISHTKPICKKKKEYRATIILFSHHKPRLQLVRHVLTKKKMVQDYSGRTREAT